MGTFPFGARSFFAGVCGRALSCAGWRSSGILGLCVPDASMPLPSCSDNQSQMSPQGVVGGANSTLVENTVLKEPSCFLRPHTLASEANAWTRGPVQTREALWAVGSGSLQSFSAWAIALAGFAGDPTYTFDCWTLNWLSLAGSDVGIPSFPQTYVPAFLVRSWWGDTCSGGPV